MFFQCDFQVMWDLILMNFWTLRPFKILQNAWKIKGKAVEKEGWKGLEWGWPGGMRDGCILRFAEAESDLEICISAPVFQHG